MEVEEAVRTAKSHVLHLFSPEGIDRVGLEEVKGSKNGTWQITIGFSRDWDQGISSVLGGPHRIYKVISIDATTGEILSVEHRSFNS